jgi:sugar phosphate isomerase/epimerase
MTMAKYGIIHYNAPGATLEEFLCFASKAGFESVELQINDVWDEKCGCCHMSQVDAVKALLCKYKLSISQLAASNDFVVLDCETVKAQVERMRKCGEIVKALGGDILRTEGGQVKDSVPQEKWVEAMAGCLKRCVEWAEPMGIRFAVDNHGYVTNEWPIQLALFEAVGSPLVRANFDTMNYRWFGHSLEKLHEIYAAIAPFAIHTHLKDGFGSRGDYRGTALGAGEIDLRWAVECLKKADYQGVYTLEYEESAEDKAPGCISSLAWMKANI